MEKTTILLLIFLGVIIISGTVYSAATYDDLSLSLLLNPDQKIYEVLKFNTKTGTIIKTSALPDRPSPSDWIKQDQIEVHEDKIIIHLEHPEWATFTDTNSMDPVIDYGTHAIEIVPSSPDQIHVGDIVSYEYEDGFIIHRVVEIGEDKYGWYAVMKGDNAPKNDPEKIRFYQVKRVLVMIIY